MMRTTTTMKATSAAFTAVLAMACLAGCAADPGPKTAAGAGNGEYDIVFTGGASLVTDWDVYVAEAEGFYEKHHVKVDNVKTETAEAANKLLVTGDAQVGRGLAPMIQAIEGSGGALDLVDVGDALIRPPFYLNVKPGITSMDQLKGKKIGTSSPTDNTTIVTIDMLNHLGMSQSDVELVSAGGTAARFAGLQGGAIDASLLFPPVAQKAIAAKFPSLGYLPDLIGNDYKYAFTSVIMNRTWLKDNPDAAKAYLAARNDSLKFLNDPANKDKVIGILAKATNVDTANAADTYNQLHIGTPQSAFASQIGIDDDAVAGTLAILQKLGQAPKDLKPSDIVDASVAASARS